MLLTIDQVSKCKEIVLRKGGGSLLTSKHKPLLEFTKCPCDGYWVSHPSCDLMGADHCPQRPITVHTPWGWGIPWNTKLKGVMDLGEGAISLQEDREWANMHTTPFYPKPLPTRSPQGHREFNGKNTRSWTIGNRQNRSVKLSPKPTVMEANKSGVSTCNLSAVCIYKEEGCCRRLKTATTLLPKAQRVGSGESEKRFGIRKTMSNTAYCCGMNRVMFLPTIYQRASPE